MCRSRHLDRACLRGAHSLPDWHGDRNDLKAAPYRRRLPAAAVAASNRGTRTGAGKRSCRCKLLLLKMDRIVPLFDRLPGGPKAGDAERED
jgi:hypothetical protein